MMNHVSCLLDNGFRVKLIGYEDSVMHLQLKSNNNLKIISLKSKALASIKKLSGRFFLIYAAFRMLLESIQLSFALLRCINCSTFLIQNPPSMPVLAIAYTISSLYSTNLVIDWHNYAWSLLKIAKRHRQIITLAYYYEILFGKLADSGFCVSHRMQSDLSLSSISASVVYDRPFPKKSSTKNMRTFLNIPPDYFLIISSTSWTIDEDFSIVLNALDILSSTSLKIFLLITGKGPLQSYYKEIISKKQWKNIRVEMAWLEIEDYPTVLKQADLGICLHVSSSGLDLPMKIVDMQEAGLPALAYNYETISEFVVEGINGELFKDSEELARKIQKVLMKPGVLKVYRNELERFREQFSWQNEWKAKALPTLQKKRTLKIRSLILCTLLILIAAMLI